MATNDMAFDLINEGGEKLDLFISDEEKDIQTVDEVYTELLGFEGDTWSTLVKGDPFANDPSFRGYHAGLPFGETSGFVSHYSEDEDYTGQRNMAGRVTSLPFGIDSYRSVESEIDEETGEEKYYHRFALDGAPTELLSDVVNFFTGITGGVETDAMDILEGLMEIKIPISKGMHDRIKSRMESRHQEALDEASQDGEFYRKNPYGHESEEDERRRRWRSYEGGGGYE